MNIYSTTVVTVGPDAEMFREQDMIILFGSEAPDNLKDFCYIIERTDVAGDIIPGQQVVIGGNRYPITAVGEVAQKNLGALGHISLVFNGSTKAEMGGTIYVDLAGQPFPLLKANDTVAIEA
ncbi:PTS glucitol/sorbitol transporter subunit IIA [Rothia nasisuis]|uniref:PTS glucitol/sorbitol transporter subunit IIA n=1 Tax=Rothia nasisuis TaxID=2109647 RepID=UPI001F2182CA|nr:PTS glucitol/sorbitol transporter subunit IIA [Rothia nasisuis]